MKKTTPQLIDKKDFFTTGLLARIMTNPFYAITVDPTFTQEHEHLVKERDWVKSCARLVKTKEITIEELLEHILDNLKGNFVTSQED